MNQQYLDKCRELEVLRR